MENKELKLLNVGGRFGLGAFFFFFFFSFSTISSWPQVSTPHSLWGVFFPPQPLIGYLNRSRSTLVFSSLSAVHQKKKKKAGGRGRGFDSCTRCYETAPATDPASLFSGRLEICTEWTDRICYWNHNGLFCLCSNKKPRELVFLITTAVLKYNQIESPK